MSPVPLLSFFSRLNVQTCVAAPTETIPRELGTIQLDLQAATGADQLKVSKVFDKIEGLQSVRYHPDSNIIEMTNGNAN